MTVAGSLLSEEQKAPYLDKVKTEYVKLKEDFASKKTVKQYLSFAQAQQNPVKIDWPSFKPIAPSFTGTKQFLDVPLADIAKYIDWGPFFIAWELHGKFPAILSDKVVGKEATKLYNDANAILQQIIDEKWLTPQGVIGFWPAQQTAPGYC